MHLYSGDKHPKGYWKEGVNCRKLFDAYAEDKGFDPSKVANWYEADLSSLREMKVNQDILFMLFNICNAQGVRRMREEQGGLRRALRNAYPELMFDEEWIDGTLASPPPKYLCSNIFLIAGDKHPKGYWKNGDNCRRLFDAFAEDNGFDPSKAENWYSASLTEMRGKKVNILSFLSNWPIKIRG